MYNAEQKQAFIFKKYPSASTQKYLTQIFNKFEKFEEAHNKDLACLSVEVLQPLINDFSGVRGKSTDVVLNLLKEYVRWCIANGYEATNGIFEVKIDAVEKIKIQMVPSPLTLLNRLNEYFDITEKETIDITYRVFLWMAFSGLTDKDAIRVTSENIDLDNSRINFEGHSYEIYEESKEDFKKALCLTDFLYEHPNYSTRKQRVSGNVLIRGVRSATVDLMSLRPIINKKVTEKQNAKGEKSDTSKNGLTYKKLRLSGAFYRAYIRESKGIPVDFSTYIAEEMERKEQSKKYTTTATRTYTVIANLLEREYLSDYQMWKTAFGLT